MRSRWTRHAKRRPVRRPKRPAAHGAKARPRRLTRRLVLRAAFVLAAAALAVALPLILTLPDVRHLEREWPERTAYMELRREQARARGQELRIDYRPVPLSRVPPELRRAVLVSEDAAFFDHRGFDWHEIRASLRRAWEERAPPRGASTITQQLARNLYLSPRRRPLRKMREALIAWQLERRLSKARILELYLNVIELGPGLFGVEAASHHYFGLGVAGLDRRESARLAATIPSPLRHNPATDTWTFRWRADLVHRRAFGAAEERIDLAEEPVEPDDGP